MSHTDTSHTTGSCNWINSHILDGVLPAFFLLLQQDSRKLLSRNTWLANYSELRNTEIRFVQIVAAFVQNFFLDICIVWGFPLEALVPSVPREQNSANVSSEWLSSALDTTQHVNQATLWNQRTSNLFQFNLGKSNFRFMVIHIDFTEVMTRQLSMFSEGCL